MIINKLFNYNTFEIIGRLKILKYRDSFESKKTEIRKYAYPYIHITHSRATVKIHSDTHTYMGARH